MLSPHADAHRKEQRKREVERNKLERKYTREACSNRDKPEQIREQLQVSVNGLSSRSLE